MLPLLLVSARVLLLVVVKLCSTQTLYRFTLHLPPIACYAAGFIVSPAPRKSNIYPIYYLIYDEWQDND